MDQRSSFLEQACAGDQSLRREVESLLTQNAVGDRFLETPAMGVAIQELARELYNRETMSLVSHKDFKGNDRFTVRRLLGAGGMGTVYEAFDQVSQQTVALKTLLHNDPAALYRLKNEFRSLADIAHPNLVSLFELFIEGESCFFTMELVDGTDFVSYTNVGSQTSSRRSGNTETKTLPLVTDPVGLGTASVPGPDAMSVGSASPPARVSPADPERLWPALRQLAAGLCALHDGGKLHRDIKPSNLLVNRAGRVVILDFGLATETAQEPAHRTLGFIGTPAYSSPEQARGGVLSPASDWYGVGVTLYQALTGKLPFEGNYVEMITRRQHFDPVPPSRLARKIPGELEELCMALMRREPAARPSGREILEWLRTKRSTAPALSVAGARRAASFFGREEPLAKLAAAFRKTKEGATVQAFIHGSSGVGKSALVRNFLRQLQDEEQVLVIAGRCYESESIPHKALDGVVDSLTRYLVSLPVAQTQALLPRDVRALAKMFPVLARIEAIAGYRSPVRDAPDPLTLRRRALNSLRELMSRISDRTPLVVFIDDLQWADADSIALLENLLRPPEAPPLLLLATFRTEQVSKLPYLQSLLDQDDGGNCVAIHLEGLPFEEAGRLALSLMGERGHVSPEFVETVVHETEGNPFLIEQFARWATSVDEVSVHWVSLADILETNMCRLPVGARTLLETVSIAARPLPTNVAFRASGLHDNALSLVTFLRSEHFLRGSTAHTLELFHDRIREGIASRLSDTETRRIHQNLAESLVASGFDDPDVLFQHYHGARQVELAARYAVLAANKASAALAFDRAAEFWRWALELVPRAPEETAHLKSEMGQTLANAGRPADAAKVYLEAAKGAEPAESLDLQRRAAEQLLVGGHVDEGLAVIRVVLDRVGLQLAPGPKAALWSLLLRRFQLWMRGLRYTERSATEIAPGQLLHIDICWTIAIGMAMFDNIRGADFQTRHLLLALRAGEPYRIARAMAMEAGFSAIVGGPGAPRSARFTRIAGELSTRVGNPHAIAITILMSGVSQFLIGEWRKALKLAESAYEILHDQCTGVLWEVTSAQNFILGSLLYLGEFAEISRRTPTMLATAHERGNLYATTEIKTRMNITWLVGDDPEAARRDLSEALRAWSHQGFHRQHYNALLAEAQIALYTGEAHTAWENVNSRWADLGRNMLMRIQVLRIEALFLKARSALAVAQSDPRQNALIREAERLARAIQGAHMPWSDPLAWTLQAGVSSLRGDRSRAEALLNRASRGFEQSGMTLFAAVAQHRLEELRGAGGAVISASAWRSMEGMGVKNPRCMLRMLAPGFPDQPSANPTPSAQAGRTLHPGALADATPEHT
jgi:serine/threonine protein kinase/tetratricopeptide (TPR) repeat protein